MSRTQRNTSRRPAKARLWLNTLEARVTPANFMVLNADDAGTGSLRDVITQANASAGADVIDFDATFFGTPQTITLATGLPTIGTELTINGPGAANLTISGGGAVRPFLLNIIGKLGAVNFNDLTIANGNVAANAGAIFCNDENVTITDSVITGCVATVQGGALNVSPYGRLTIRNSSISNNTLNSPYSGGAIFMAGRAELTISNSSLTGNTANGANGGAVALYGINTLLIENSTISGNTSTKAVLTGTVPSGGGGLFVYGAPQGPGWIIRNSTIAGNTAVGNGGGLLVAQNAGAAASMIIQNCTITGNTANGGAGSVGGGGGVSRVQGNAILNITSTVIAENTDTSGAAPDIQSGGTVNVNNSLIGDALGFTPTGANNLAPGTPTNLGPLQNNGGPVQTRVPAAGSALINAGTNPSAGTNLSAIVSSAFGTDARGPGFSRNVGGLTDIGAAEAGVTAGASATANAPDVTANGANIYNFSVTYATPSALDVGSLGNDDITVNGPAGSGYSQGATFVSVNGNTATYTVVPPGGTFDAADYGAFSIDVNNGAVTFGTGAGSIPAGPAGRAKFLNPATFTVTAAVDTGAGSLRQAILDANARIFTNDIIAFTPGLAGSVTLGGRMTINDPVTINGSGAGVFTLNGNNATGLIRTQGPGIIPVTITDMTLTGGNALTAINGSTGGGAIFASNEDLTLDRVRIENNVSPTFGGGISAGSNLMGGPTPGLLTIRNSTIAGNTANGAAGLGTGGGISIPFGGRLILEDSTVSGNVSTASAGGGIYLVGSSPDGSVIRNSTIFGNLASTTGGGVSLTTLYGPVLISNSTIAGNSATTGAGGNVFQSGAAIATLTSSVLAFGNSGGGSPDYGGAVTSDSSLILDQTGATITDGGNNLAAGTDPLFVGGGTPTLADNGGPTFTIALQNGSPLLNVGANPGNLLTDQRGAGFARTSGAGTDIGAFEVQGAGVAPTVLSTVVNNSTSLQRSRVTSLVVTFSNTVTFAGAPASAFTLRRNSDNAIVNFTATPVVNGLGQTVVTLDNFTGATTQSGSLGDGNYTLTALASQISNGGTNMAADYTFGSVPTDRMYRFYGDFSGGDRRVDISDFGFFSAGYLQGPGANVPALDFNQDGRLDITDFGQFSVRFFTTLP